MLETPGSADPAAAPDPAPGPVPEAPVRVWPVYLVTALLLLGMVLLAGFALAVFAFFAGGGVDDAGTAAALTWYGTLPGFLWTSGVSVAWIGAIALAGAWISRAPIAARLGWTRAGLPAAGWALAIVGGLALSQAIDLVLTLTGLGRGGALDFMVEVLSRARGGALVAAVLVVGVGAGTAEELFFRGYAQRRLVARYGAPTGIAIAAALFALAHGDPRHGAFAFGFGLFAGAIAHWSGSTRPAIAVHVANNAVSVVTIAAGFDGFDPHASRFVLALAAAGLFAVALACARGVRRQSARWTAARVLG